MGREQRLRLGCAQCGGEIPISPHWRKYCGSSCAQAAARHRENKRKGPIHASKDCAECGRALPRRRNSRRKYCDEKCNNRANNRRHWERNREEIQQRRTQRRRERNSKRVCFDCSASLAGERGNRKRCDSCRSSLKYTPQLKPSCCEWCGLLFNKKNNGQKYCQKSCKLSAYADAAKDLITPRSDDEGSLEDVRRILEMTRNGELW